MSRTASVLYTLCFFGALCLAPPVFATDDTPGEDAGTETPLRLKLGGNDYETYCASCHGVSGRGDGPVAEFLALTPADLTQLSRKNGGRFPAERVAQIIDGRQDVRIHGTRDMPVWGDWFDVEAESPGLRASEREMVVQERIKALLVYLETIQVK
ncbi:MAG: cytochrome c [Rhizobiales bacterium]|nr:cytochrome c [Hyphomicrobiales bacterium]